MRTKNSLRKMSNEYLTGSQIISKINLYVNTDEADFRLKNANFYDTQAITVKNTSNCQKFLSIEHQWQNICMENLVSYISNSLRNQIKVNNSRNNYLPPVTWRHLKKHRTKSEQFNQATDKLVQLLDSKHPNLSSSSQRVKIFYTTSDQRLCSSFDF